MIGNDVVVRFDGTVLFVGVVNSVSVYDVVCLVVVMLSFVDAVGSVVVAVIDTVVCVDVRAVVDACISVVSGPDCLGVVMATVSTDPAVWVFTPVVLEPDALFVGVVCRVVLEP